METQILREVSLRYGKKNKSFKCNDPSLIAEFLRSKLLDETQEHFFAIYLDSQLQAVAWKLIAKGSTSFCSVAMKDILAPALHLCSNGLVVAHNHPSESLNFSIEDIELSKNLKEATKLLGIKLLDSIIFTKSSYVSAMETSKI
jgi:DNA repair protein RadC